MFCLKWISHGITHLGLYFRCDIALKKSILAKQINDSIYFSSTTKTGGHDIVEILMKVALKHQK
jgi:hypothetical protein